MVSMRLALAEGGCASQTEWVAKFPGVHCWFLYGEYPCCANCGKVKVRDPSKQKPCRGIVTVTLRSSEVA